MKRLLRFIFGDAAIGQAPWRSVPAWLSSESAASRKRRNQWVAAVKPSPIECREGKPCPLCGAQRLFYEEHAAECFACGQDTWEDAPHMRDRWVGLVLRNGDFETDDVRSVKK